MPTALLQTFASKLTLHLLLCTLLLLASDNRVQAKALRIAVPDYPPYTYVQDKQLTGEGFQAFDSIMAELDVEYRAEIVPHFGRSILDMENNQLDAMLLATESPERSHLAEYSEPLFFTDWAWVWLTKREDINPENEHFKEIAVVSAQKNSNIYRWLALQDYQITPGTSDVRDLFNLLDHGRVDAIMLPALTATTLINNNQRDTKQYKIRKHIQLPYGIYVSKAYLVNHPDFMQKLNQAIKKYNDEIKQPVARKTEVAAPKN
ncbi:substrate-binding periplasmic protein [Arsukibacterium indicum]|uniref:Transporter substrate-binding domain-containing protein n=1 Tax=Arsukibacterium indicum TaxID=2848612 RepID=A0ABS6MIS6_9GAMM|nr:transporter substrate-binding domain-containing protein [Arsukibacterium indicum]MBV2128708.1 transporter substrate-binding domain-containing protein [Arsukibacterium indicum]